MGDQNDLTFFTNESERNLYDRFNKILQSNTQLKICGVLNCDFGDIIEIIRDKES